MDNLSKALDLLKIPNPFRDIIISICGLGVIFLFEISSSKYNLIEKINTLNLHRLESSLMLLLVAYVLGRLLSFLSDIILIIIDTIRNTLIFIFLEEKPLKSRFYKLKNEWKFNWKDKIKGFLEPSRKFSSVSPEGVKNEINIIEISRLMSSAPGLANEAERKTYSLIILRIFFSASLIAALLLSKYYYISSIIFLVLFISNLRSLKEGEYFIYRSAVKEIGLKKNNNSQL